VVVGSGEGAGGDVLASPKKDFGFAQTGPRFLVRNMAKTAGNGMPASRVPPMES